MKRYSLRRLSLSSPLTSKLPAIFPRRVALDLSNSTSPTVRGKAEAFVRHNKKPTPRSRSQKLISRQDKPPVARYFASPYPAPSLEKLRFDAMNWHKSDRKETIGGWEVFFADLALAPSPACTRSRLSVAAGRQPNKHCSATNSWELIFLCSQA
ncbi:hypothetical protein C8R43DRAFT_582628 [Mycena crocata]|nr:hypothetical protein C8R43DRAFT_582628 [Mycena crocata]